MHTGKVCPAPLGELQVIATVETDADATAENEFSGFLQIHEGTAVSLGDFVVVGHSSNFNENGFTDETGISTKIYDVRAYHWVPSVTAVNRLLVPAWTAPSDWQPVDVAIASFGYQTNGYVQVFQPVLAGGSVFVPGASGTIVRRELRTGAIEAVIDPLVGTAFSGDPLVVQAGALSVSPAGKVYETITAHPTDPAPFGKDPRGAWVSEIDPATNGTRLAQWSLIASKTLGIPTTGDPCVRPFFLFNRQPTGPDDHTNVATCGAQRPATNVPPAFDAGGNMYVLSYATKELSAAFIVKVSTTTLASTQAFDVRGHVLHGCGVRLPLGDPSLNDCDIITANGAVQIGFDPDYNAPTPFHGFDLMDGAPTVAPNGDLAITGYTGGLSFFGEYDARGAGVAFTSTGVLRGVQEFGWEVTNGVQPGLAGTFRYIADLQRYSDLDLGVSALSSTFAPLATGRLPIDFDRVAIDFLDVQPALNSDGGWCGVNGMGIFACFSADGTLTNTVDLLDANGDPVSMETEANHIARDSAGDYLVNYAGKLWVIAGGGAKVSQPSVQELRPSVGQMARRMLAGAAKAASLASMPIPAL